MIRGNIQLQHPKWRKEAMAFAIESARDQNASVFSEDEILKWILEELNHEESYFQDKHGQTLQSMSSGERKVAFLSFLLTKKPALLILDHAFDNLDVSNVEIMRKQLEGIGAESIIHIYTRADDALSFLKENHLFGVDGLLQGTIDRAEEDRVEELIIPAPLTQLESPSDILFDLKNIAVAYFGKPVLNGVNWQVKKGELWQLVGANGAGKTTLLSMIVGDNPKAYGQDITLFGHKKGSGESIWEIKKMIGYFTSDMTFQFWRFQPIKNMIISGFYDSIGLYKKAGDQQSLLAMEWLRCLGLFKDRETPFVKVSKCHQRMVMIARAMVKHPPLLILDEPTVGLNDEDVALIVRLINHIAQQTDTCIIYVSHRAEKGLKPTHTLKLIASPEGSSSEVMHNA